MEREEITELRDRLDFAAGRSQLYHAKRRDFFQLLHDSTSWLTAIGSGGTALSAFLEAHGIATRTLAVFVFVLAAADKAFKFGPKSRKHDTLNRRFGAVARRIHSMREPTEDQIRKIKSAMDKIEEGEPTVLHVLNLICRNELAISRGAPEEVFRLRWWQELFAQFVSLPPRTWKTATKKVG